MSGLRNLALTALSVWFLACTGPAGGSAGPSSPSAEPSSPASAAAEARCVTASSGHRFCDETTEGGFDLAAAYEDSKFACTALSVAELARELHTDRDPASAALGWAENYEGAARQAAYEGCLDGLLRND
jgi:protein-disulfide isomerase-like protein with CxxC motif